MIRLTFTIEKNRLTLHCGGLVVAERFRLINEMNAQFSGQILSAEKKRGPVLQFVFDGDIQPDDVAAIKMVFIKLDINAEQITNA